MNMKIPIIAITAFVVVVVIGSVLIPVLDDAKDDEKTVFNNNYNRYSRLLDSDIDSFSMTITWNVTTTTAYVTVGDESYNYAMSSSRVPLICTEEGMLNANKVNSRGVLTYSGSASSINITDSPITIEVASGTVTLTDGASTPNVYTWDVGSWLFYPDNDGNYTAMNTTSDKDTEIYLNSIDDLYFATVINTDSLGFVSGHGATCKFFNQTDTPTYAMNLVSSQLAGYTDVITTTIGSYTVSEDAGTNTDGTPFNPFITMVPRAVDGHTSQDNSIIAIYEVIPALVIIALVVGVIALVFRSKMD